MMRQPTFAQPARATAQPVGAQLCCAIAEPLAMNFSLPMARGGVNGGVSGGVTEGLNSALDAAVGKASS